MGTFTNNSFPYGTHWSYILNQSYIIISLGLVLGTGICSQLTKYFKLEKQKVLLINVVVENWAW